MDEYEKKIKPYLHKIQEWYANGHDDKFIAKQLRIKRSNWHIYRRDCKELRGAYNAGMEIADVAVKDALFECAIGYEYTEKKKRAIIDKETGKTTKVVVEETTKRKPPDVVAIKMWLTNRNPDDWKEKVNIEHGVGNSFADMLAALYESVKE